MAGTPALRQQNSTIELWIRRTLASDPPRAKSLVVSVFGDAIAPHGGSVQLKGLIELLEPFGINERLVRTSVFRLVKEDWLEASRTGRESSYELTTSGRRRLSYAYERIYSRKVEPWEGSWTLVLVRSDELSAEKRQALRQELEWQGVRQLAPHLFGHPRIDPDLLAELLERVGVRRKVISFCNARAEQIGASDIRELINERWNLAGVIKHYRKFLRDFERVGHLLEPADALSVRQWFVMRILVLHTFRRLVLHDPLLPEELLPEPWIGNDAYQLAGKFYRLSLSASERHLGEVCGFNGNKGSASILAKRFC